MKEAYCLVWSALVLLFRSRVSLEAEILILRHQLNIQRRHLPKRLTFSAMDRLILAGLYRLVPSSGTTARRRQCARGVASTSLKLRNRRDAYARRRRRGYRGSVADPARVGQHTRRA